MHLNMDMYQRTVGDTIGFSGIGLHTGLPVSVRILPSGEGTGISFVRRDIPGSPVIKAKYKNVVSTSFATTLGVDGVTVSTVEHLLAALYGMGVDNALIEVDGPEVPIMDGSAVPFVEMIEKVGLSRLDSPRRYIVIRRPLKVSENEKYIYLMPPGDADGEDLLSIDYTIDFAHSYLNRQSFTFSLSPGAFKREIVGARTFGFLKDVEMLKKNGLALGGSLKNAVVIGDDDILNEEGLRYTDEFVRHKVLDLIGDLALLGMPLIGRIKAYRSGHALNQSLVTKVLKTPRRWKMLEFVEAESATVPVLSEELVTA